MSMMYDDKSNTIYAFVSEGEWKRAMATVRTQTANQNPPVFGRPSYSEIVREIKRVERLSPIPNAGLIRHKANKTAVDAMREHDPTIKPYEFLVNLDHKGSMRYVYRMETLDMTGYPMEVPKRVFEISEDGEMIIHDHNRLCELAKLIGAVFVFEGYAAEEMEHPAKTVNPDFIRDEYNIAEGRE